MCGVIDENGVQWERCNCCGKFTKLANLRYGRVRIGLTNPWPDHNFLDLCAACAEPEAKPATYFFCTSN